MIDPRARSQLAQAARGLVVGRLTNDQFEDRVPHSTDPAIREIYEKGFWPLYDDLIVHRLTGERSLSPDNRHFAARCIVFLKSGLPYRWPAISPLRLLVANLFTLGLAGYLFRRHQLSAGDPSAWPFLNQSEYRVALGSPSYLHGLGPNNSFKPMPLRGTA
jgi:hypothetical protein